MMRLERDGGKEVPGRCRGGFGMGRLEEIGALGAGAETERGLHRFDLFVSHAATRAEIQVPPWPWDSDPGIPTCVGGRRVSEPTGPDGDSSR